ncbi:hypothetical protein [Bifidobacterium thermophilum]|uniref:hypothetical protein n=1 Tax=Bifidobacterium thermophilum TaxID=33905 RepID=UPI003F9253D8
MSRGMESPGFSRGEEVKSLTIAQQLESLQAVIANLGVAAEQGQALWDRFQRHLKQGYRSLTQGERLFWLTAYTGDPQPDSLQLLDILKESRSREIRKAAVTYYVHHQGKQGVTDDWRATVADLLKTPGELRAIIAPIADETMMRGVCAHDAVAPWMQAHPQAGDETVDQWLYGGDGINVEAVVDYLSEPTRLAGVDMQRVVDTVTYGRYEATWAFARKVRFLSVRQLEILLDSGFADVEGMLINGGPYTDGQMDMLDKRDHETVESALWFYRQEAGKLSRERARYFADKDSRFAARIDKAINDETYEKLHLA